ncbi:tail completion protein gp17 [Caldalkalibacillus salinus]|uniref:tail completion protein gp17 n=1 Tax=Caldalkalibacillus salinus TaxID=2803787 RepID=UPI0019208B34
MSALLNIQLALEQTLKDDAALMSKITGVYDHVPPDANYPYVVIGEATEEPLNTFAQGGMQVLAVIRIMSGALGYNECFDILKTVNDCLNQQPLVVDQYETISSVYQNAETVVEEPTDARQVQAIYRIVVQKVES